MDNSLFVVGTAAAALAWTVSSLVLGDDALERSQSQTNFRRNNGKENNKDTETTPSSSSSTDSDAYVIDRQQRQNRKNEDGGYRHGEQNSSSRQENEENHLQTNNNNKQGNYHTSTSIESMASNSSSINSLSSNSSSNFNFGFFNKVPSKSSNKSKGSNNSISWKDQSGEDLCTYAADTGLRNSQMTTDKTVHYKTHSSRSKYTENNDTASFTTKNSHLSQSSNNNQQNNIDINNHSSSDTRAVASIASQRGPTRITRTKSGSITLVSNMHTGNSESSHSSSVQETHARDTHSRDTHSTQKGNRSGPQGQQHGDEESFDFSDQEMINSNVQNTSNSNNVPENIGQPDGNPSPAWGFYVSITPEVKHYDNGPSNSSRKDKKKSSRKKNHERAQNEKKDSNPLDVRQFRDM